MPFIRLCTIELRAINSTAQLHFLNGNTFKKQKQKDASIVTYGATSWIDIIKLSFFQL